MVTGFQEYLFGPTDESDARKDDPHLVTWVDCPFAACTPSHGYKELSFFRTPGPHLVRMVFVADQQVYRLAVTVTRDHRREQVSLQCQRSRQGCEPGWSHRKRPRMRLKMGSQMALCSSAKGPVL